MDYHIPVLFEECMQALNVVSGRLYFDGTLGGGGHSFGILSRGGRLIATDRDMDALDHARQRFASQTDFNGRYTLVHDNFKNAKQILSERGIESLDGAILDLGISSHQVDVDERGFSYCADAPLDMRMDRDQYLSAMTVVNQYDEEELARILYTYGEERASRRIAARIVQTRKDTPIETTRQLADLVRSCLPYNAKGGHPAKRTFQAIRIEVNNELSGLGEVISDLTAFLKRGARIAVISFHSLEDRIVKQTLKSLAADCICDKSLPLCVCNHHASVKLISPKGVTPAQAELTENPRSRSATLRIAQKI